LALRADSLDAYIATDEYESRLNKQQERGEGIAMQVFELWLVVTVPMVALVQWWATRRLHRKALAVARARHVNAQQAAAKMLHQSRQQIAQLQRELSAARLTASRATRTTPARPASVSRARESLLGILDDAPRHRPALPVDGFAETMPSQQFPHASAFGSL
jgi:hypothetical protein